LVTSVRPDKPERVGRLSSPVLVGRADELAVLLEATLRTPALILMEGESGVGKTRLVQELLARPELAGRPCFVGRCHELSEPFPLGPLLEALREARPPRSLPAVVGTLRPLLPELAGYLPDAPATLGDPGAERHRLFRGLRALLTSFGPSLLVVEDLHWADQPTLEFLRFLSLQPPPGLAVVCTYRREDLADGSAVLRLDAGLPSASTAARVALVPLSQDEIRELVRTILDTADVSPAFAEYLFQRTAGLPLAVEEVLLLLKQRQDLVYRQGMWVRQQLDELAVPPRLRDAINERLGRLTPPARSIAQAAAVLSLAADEQLLGRLAGLDELACGDAVAEALGSALLFELSDGRYGFRHALARQAVEEGVPAPVRRRLHLRAAAALEEAADKPLARLAHHYRTAGDTTKWVSYAEAAADRAVSLNDHAAAYALLRNAVSIESLMPDTRGSLSIKLARHAARCRAYDDAITILRTLLGEGSIPADLRGELRFWLGRLMHDAGDPQAAHAEVVRALGDMDESSAAQAMAWLAVVPSSVDPVEQRLRWLDRAQRIASRSNDRVTRIEIAANRAVVLVGVGDPQGQQAIEEIPAPGPPRKEMERAMRGYGNVADALLHLGHYGRAEQVNRRALELAAAQAPPFAANFELTNLQLDWLTGRWRGLEQKVQTQIRTVEDWPSALRSCEALLGLLTLAHGHPQQALALLGPLAHTLEDDIRVLNWVAAGIARIRLAERNPDAAVEASAPALHAIEANGTWVWAGDVAPVGVEALVGAGCRDEAGELTARFADALAGRDAPAASAALSGCRAVLAEADEEWEAAAGLYVAAEEQWRVLPRPYEAARARVSAGRCLLTHDSERGHERLLEGLSMLAELGAAWEAESVRHTLRQHGLIPPHRRGRRSYGNELSPREAQIARLAAEGLHNREIARTLYLSVKTVEGHVSSAIRKLGVGSRSELGEQFRAG